MNRGPQGDALALGQWGCYYLCLLHLVGRDGDAIGLYYNAHSAGAIDDECWVANPATVLSLAAGGTWEVRHETSTYIPVRGEKEILRFERKTSAGLIGHFVVGDGKGHVLWDPKADSVTVREGKLVSKRIVRRTA